MGNIGSNSSLKEGEKSPYLKESFKEHNHAVNCIAIADDQSLLVVGSEDCTISMWSTVTKVTENLGKLVGHTAYITCLAVFDTFVISGSADETIKKWDMATCECLVTFEGHTSRISRVLCTGDFIFSTSYDHTAKAWLFDIDEYDDEEDISALVRTFSGHVRGVYSMIFIPDEEGTINEELELNIRPKDMLITGSADNTARSWSFDTGCVIQVFRGHTKPITSISLDVTGTNLYTGSTDGNIRAWVLDDGTCIRVMEGHQGPVISILVVNRLMYSGSTDGAARCWVTEFGDCTRVFEGHKHSVCALKFHNGVLYTGCGDSMIRAFDAKTGKLVRCFEGHKRAVTSLVVVDKKLYSGSFDGHLKVWNTSDIEIKKAFNDDEDDRNLVNNKLKNRINKGGMSNIANNNNQMKRAPINQRKDEPINPNKERPINPNLGGPINPNIGAPINPNKGGPIKQSKKVPKGKKGPKSNDPQDIRDFYFQNYSKNKKFAKSTDE